MQTRKSFVEKTDTQFNHGWEEFLFYLFRLAARQKESSAINVVSGCQPWAVRNKSTRELMLLVKVPTNM